MELTESTVRPKLPQVIQTERLLLRPSLPGDGAEVNAAIRETYEQLRVYMPWADPPPTVEESEESSCQGLGKYESSEYFGLNGYRKSDGAFVLRVGLYPEDWKVPRLKFGYWCRTSMQGKGYVTEAVSTLTKAGFDLLKARRIEIICDSRNLPSCRVAERCGYKLEAELRNQEIAADGVLQNTLIFAMIPDDYVALTLKNFDFCDIGEAK